MSTLSRNILVSAILSATAIPALAATEERGTPDNLVVWMFLGLCALIIVAQIAPLIRNVRKQSKLASEQTKASEQTHSN